MKDETTAPRRLTLTLAVIAILVVALVAQRDAAWLGSAALHSVMESVATVLSAIVGVLALVRFYSRKDNTFLFLGAGFLGTALLDGYHGIVTAPFFPTLMPSPPPSLIPWSWLASRLFLAVLLWLSGLARHRDERLGEAGRVSEAAVYWGGGMLALASCAFFALDPLPRASYPALAFSRPQEAVPAIFFALAFAGCWRGGGWRRGRFEFWLLLSILLGLLVQVPLMASSRKLFDPMFDLAHALKIASYGCVFIGLATSMHELFRRGEKSVVELREMTASLQGEVGSRTRAEGSLREVLGEVRAGIAVLGGSAGNVSQSTADLAASADQTATAIREISATIEEIRQTARLTSEKARLVAEGALEAARVSEAGKHSTDEITAFIRRVQGEMESIAAGMQLLSGQTATIGAIVATVDDLAAHANLLSVNAAIEAAKAGDQGKGFAVVAQEVKSLAQQSREATGKVRGILRDILQASASALRAVESGGQAVAGGVRQAAEAGRSIAELAGRIGAAAESAQQIAVASRQQLAGVDQVALAMGSVQQAATHSVGGARQLQSAARELNELGERLRRLVGGADAGS